MATMTDKTKGVHLGELRCWAARHLGDAQLGQLVLQRLELSGELLLGLLAQFERLDLAWEQQNKRKRTGMKVRCGWRNGLCWSYGLDAGGKRSYPLLSFNQ